MEEVPYPERIPDAFIALKFKLPYGGPEGSAIGLKSCSIYELPL